MSLSTTAVLGMIRRLVAEVDEIASDLTDPELLAVVDDVRLENQVRGMATFGTYVVVSEQTESGYGITPDPEDIDAVILAYGTATRILDDAYRGRLGRGELGVSWTSGLEAESTISAATAYLRLIDRIARKYDEFKAIKRANSSGFRMQ
jgi:hypothetical protein